MDPTNFLIFQMMVSTYTSTLKAQYKTNDNAYIGQMTFEHFCMTQLVSKYRGAD